MEESNQPDIGSSEASKGSQMRKENLQGNSGKDPERFSKSSPMSSLKSVQNAKGKKANNKKNSSNGSVNDQQIDLDEYTFGGLKYKLPSKRQRVIVASLVIGLNALLVIAVILYFNNSSFQQFIYNVGRG